jgi:hypothetical protein
LVGHRSGIGCRAAAVLIFITCLPSKKQRKRVRAKEQSMDAVYVLLGLGFSTLSYGLVRLIGRLQ